MSNINQVHGAHRAAVAEAALDMPQTGGRVEAADVEDTLAVSVVVPTCGRPDLLGKCLGALTRQACDPARFEIIVVDDAPADSTRVVVKAWSASTRATGLRIAYLPSPGPHGPAAARNRGWRAARAAIVAFTDDDTMPDPDWLANGLRVVEPDVQAVWGRIVMPHSGVPTDYELDAKGLERAEFVTANCFCRKKVLEQIGGFDERFEFAWREDADLYFRLLDRPGRIVHAPAAVVVHPIRPAAWGVSLRQQKKIQSDALLYKKHGALYRQRIRATPRWDYYAVVLSLLAWLGALVFGQYQAASIAGGIWLALTGRFFVQRLAPTAKTPSHIAEMLVTSMLIPPLAVFWRAVGAVKFRVRFL